MMDNCRLRSSSEPESEDLKEIFPTFHGNLRKLICQLLILQARETLESKDSDDETDFGAHCEENHPGREEGWEAQELPAQSVNGVGWQGPETRARPGRSTAQVNEAGATHGADTTTKEGRISVSGTQSRSFWSEHPHRGHHGNVSTDSNGVEQQKLTNGRLRRPHARVGVHAGDISRRLDRAIANWQALASWCVSASEGAENDGQHTRTAIAGKRQRSQFDGIQ